MTEAATEPAGTIATSTLVHAGYDPAADIKYPSDTPLALPTTRDSRELERGDPEF
jgi:hypothetical protein